MQRSQLNKHPPGLSVYSSSFTDFLSKYKLIFLFTLMLNNCRVCWDVTDQTDVCLVEFLHRFFVKI